VSFEFISACQVWRILDTRKILCCIFGLGAFNTNWKSNWKIRKEINGPSPGEQLSSMCRIGLPRPAETPTRSISQRRAHLRLSVAPSSPAQRANRARTPKPTAVELPSRQQLPKAAILRAPKRCPDRPRSHVNASPSRSPPDPRPTPRTRVRRPLGRAPKENILPSLHHHFQSHLTTSALTLPPLLCKPPVRARLK
jgi:hypothetical protein